MNAATTTTAHEPLSSSAVALLNYCRDHSPVAQYGDARGKRVVFLHWPSVAAAMGLQTCNGDDWRAIRAALDELHGAGLLSYHDHGPGTYGHTSTIFNAC